MHPAIVAALIAAGAVQVNGVVTGINRMNQEMRGKFTRELAYSVFKSLDNVIAVVVTCQNNDHNGQELKRDILCGCAYYEIIVFRQPGFYRNLGDGGFCNHAIYGRSQQKGHNYWEFH